MIVLLKTRKSITSDDPLVLLRAQHKLLLKLCNRYPDDEVIQNYVGDANMLGLSAQDLIEEKI